jgi:CysZ protein
MKFFKDFFKGVSNSFKGFSLLFEKGLWPYMFYPLLVWILLWVASLYGLFLLAGGISDWLQGYFSFESIPENGHWLSWARPFLVSKVGFIVTWVLKILFWFMSGTFIKYLMLIVMSPVFALLSEKAEEKLTGKEYPFSLVQLMKDIGRGIVISLRNMILEYFFIFVCTLVSFFFPPLFFITTPFLFLLGWYFVGFALIDYNCERHKFGVSKSIQFMKKNRGYACGVGFVYSFFLALPFVPGQIIGMMFGPAIAVIGGTISFLEVQGGVVKEVHTVQNTKN